MKVFLALFKLHSFAFQEMKMIKITLTLPETVYQHAANLATATHLDIASIVSEALAITLPAFDEALVALTPTAAARAEAVRVVSDSQTTMIMRRLLQNDKPLRERLQQWRDEGMSTGEITALLSLLLMQRRGWLMQSAAMAEPQAFDN
jgi:hypothetical protein